MNTKELNQLKKLFTESQVSDEKIAADKIYMESSNVCGIVPKTSGAKQQIVNTFFTNEGNAPTINYDSVAKFSTDYLRIILKILEASGEESVELRLSTDNPLMVSTQEYDIILAPRMRY